MADHRMMAYVAYGLSPDDSDFLSQCILFPLHFRVLESGNH